jgi:hypothetical protein
MASCSLLDSAIVINKPNLPTINICDNVATDSDVSTMKTKIEDQAFKGERMDRAKYVTKGYCFTSKQVVNIMDSFSNAKKLLLDMYHRIDNDFLQNYLNEFCFKLNRRNFNCIFERRLTACVLYRWDYLGETRG